MPALRSPCFNGAATFRSRNVGEGAKREAAPHQLQWGRDLSVAECTRGAGGNGRRGRASMGPRPFGRGMRGKSVAQAPQGQASMGPRPFGRGMPKKRRKGSLSSCSFNGAATFRSRNVLSRCRRPSDSPLQWGRDLSVAECTWSGKSDDAQIAASMGPRPFGRGMRRSQMRLLRRASRFNGAATFRSRNARAARSADRTAVRFNGAATFRSRNGVDSARPPLPARLLQWGRDLSVAE